MNFSPSLTALLAQATTAAPAAAADPAASASQAPGWTSFVPLIAIFAAFYFLLIRPQMKARKEQDKLVNALKSGDDVVTTSGILGTVTNVKEKTVLIRIAEGVKIEVLKSAVTTVTPKTVVDTTPAKVL